MEVVVGPFVGRDESAERKRLCVVRNVLGRVMAVEQRLRGATQKERLDLMEKTEHYMDHEVKNRLIMLEESSAKAPNGQLHALIMELIETISLKNTLMRLATGRYTARLEDVDLEAILANRIFRYTATGRRIDTARTAGDAAGQARSLRLDPVLVKIILDNIFSNAFKYGDTEQPLRAVLTIGACATPCDGGPAVDVELELWNAPGEDLCRSMLGGRTDASRVDERTNDVDFNERRFRPDRPPPPLVAAPLRRTPASLAGLDHASLLALGEDELNHIAATDGARAHEACCASTSRGDGFPMALASAQVLGGPPQRGLSNFGCRVRLVEARLQARCASCSGRTAARRRSWCAASRSAAARTSRPWRFWA
ncbi:hypothetical protein M885DRAFT_179475 [Pelagophyceae sp. CCMP2097]|nr:hypothetical protein M885DRAFT_179475 [Pelagophyceae sp. CCMP2097]